MTELQKIELQKIELQKNNTDDELFQIMKAKMNTEEEQIFMTSHYLFLQYGSDNTKFVIDFDDVWKNVEFTQKVSAKRLLEKHFKEHIDYKIVASTIATENAVSNTEEKIALPKCKAKNDVNTRGGQNKEIILLTVDCFKNFCMLASTPKSKVIRSYYVKMENIMHEYFRLKNNELQNTLQLSQNALQVSIKETAIKRHEVLIETNRNKCLVYFCRIQLYDDGSFILKIGESTDIKNRIEALSCSFETNIIVLDVFNCENSVRFEKFLHNSPEITKYKYNHLEHKNKKLSTEAYLIPNQKEYEKIIKFAKSELSKYNSMELRKLRIEEKKSDLLSSFLPYCKSYDEIMNILNRITSPVNSKLEIEPTNEIIENEEVHDHYQQDQYQDQYQEESGEKGEITNSNITTPNSNGPIVQIYHKDNLKKVTQVFNSIMEATRDFNYNDKTASFTAIKKAYQHKTLYLDHRWHFIINRQELDLQKARDIGETVIIQERNQGQVAMLNIDKTKIIKVFKLSKDAAKEIVQHPSAVCSAIKHGTPLNNHYWIRWENVSSSLQNKYLEVNTLPIKQKNVRGTKIKLLHPVTNEIIKIFSSYTDIQKEMKISARKIKELIETNETYNGKYKFKLV
jgi:phage anti-repressor protein